MKLTFLGAALTVTGSSFLIKANNHKILVDCGMFQGGKAIEEFNRREFAYNPAELDCVVLTHAHIDHSGLLPRLCNEGFRGPIYSTKVTRELCNIMLPDSGHIQEFDAEIANRKGKRAGKAAVLPLYTVDDAFACLEQFSPLSYDVVQEIVPAISIRFRNAGHILGSAMAEVWITEGEEKQKIVFSGDIGHPGQPIIKDPTYIEDADFLVMESTYGNRIHQHYNKEQKLAEIINETVSKGGNVIIPAFAVGRTQTLLYYFRQLFKAGQIPKIPVIIDSPLAISATDIFMHNIQEYDTEAYNEIKPNEHPLHMPQLKFARSADESKAINNINEPKIIISASGMADAGRILHHLKHNLWCSQCSILLVGYQAEGSLGRRLLEGAKKVKILGEEISVKAKIYNLDGFSAHGDKEYLLQWLSSYNTKPANVFLVHGEIDATEEFAEAIAEKLNLPTFVPQFGDSAIISGRHWRIEKSQLPQIMAVDPELQQLQEQLSQLEAEYEAYKQNLQKIVAGDKKKASEALRRMEKVTTFIKKSLSDILKNA